MDGQDCHSSFTVGMFKYKFNKSPNMQLTVEIQPTKKAGPRAETCAKRKLVGLAVLVSERIAALWHEVL